MTLQRIFKLTNQPKKLILYYLISNQLVCQMELM